MKTGRRDAGRLARASASSSAGAERLYLPPYWPDLSPIEKAWAKLNLLLRAAKASTVPALDQAIADLLSQIATGNAGAWFRLRVGPIQK